MEEQEKENLILAPSGVYKVGDFIGNEKIIRHYGIYHYSFGKDEKVLDIFLTRKMSKLKSAMCNVLKEHKNVQTYNC